MFNRRYLHFFIITLFLSCFSNKNKVLIRDNHDLLLKKYNYDFYITSITFSPTDFHHAENTAIINISKEINSQIEHQFVSHESYIESKGKRDFKGEYLDIISHIKVTSKFDHTELIKFDPDSYIRDKKGNYYVLGYLKRMDLYNLLSPKYNNETIKFYKTSELIEQNIKEGNFRSLLDRLKELKGQYSQILKYAYEMYVVSKRYPNDKEKIEEVFLKVISDVLEFKGKIILYVNSNGSEDINGHLFIISQRVISDLKLKSEFNGDCKGKNSHEYKLSFDAVDKCNQGNLGYLCLFDRFKATLSKCMDNAEIFNVDLNKNELKGVHTKSTEKAKSALIDRIERLKVSEDLLKKLGEYFVE